MKIQQLLIAALLSVLLPASSLFAHQPNPVIATVTKSSPTKGNFKTGADRGGDALITINLKGASGTAAGKNILVVMGGCTEDRPVQGQPVLNLTSIIDDPTVTPIYATSWTRPTPLWRACPAEDAYLIKPKKNVQMPVQVDFLRSASVGTMVNMRGRAYFISSAEMSKANASQTKEKDGSSRGLAQRLAAVVDKSRPDGLVEVGLNFRLNSSKKSWTRGSWSSVFGSGYAENDVEISQIAGDFADIAATEAVHLPSYTRTMPGMTQSYDGGARLDSYYSLMTGYGSGDPSESACIENPEYAVYPSSLGGGDQQVQASVTHTITGRISAKWTFDHAWHPAFGFDVEAWTRTNGEWRLLARTISGGNGRWTLQIQDSANFDGSLLRMIYRAGQKGYYSIKKVENDHTYKFRDPDRLNIASELDVGHRTLNTDDSSYSGVGELTEAAIKQGVMIYWNSNINPVRENEMTIYFPNTDDVCNGQVWSCASPAGTVWLIQEHGTDPTVVIHELGHQLNNEYWEFNPANTGGQHFFDSCYPGRLGMALKEGFANFMAGWVGYWSRNVDTGGFANGRYALPYDLEQTDEPPECGEEGYSNEVWVARTLWDLHDTHADGLDNIYFRHVGAVMAIYLRNGPSADGQAYDIRDLMPIYQDAASAGHEDNVADIFEQNAN